MKLLTERDKTLKLIEELKLFKQEEITSKFLSVEAKDINLDLKYANEYITWAINSLNEVALCLYHTDIFLKSNTKWQTKKLKNLEK